MQLRDVGRVDLVEAAIAAPRIVAVVGNPVGRRRLDQQILGQHVDLSGSERVICACNQQAYEDYGVHRCAHFQQSLFTSSWPNSPASAAPRWSKPSVPPLEPRPAPPK